MRRARGMGPRHRRTSLAPVVGSPRPASHLLQHPLLQWQARRRQRRSVRRTRHCRHPLFRFRLLPLTNPTLHLRPVRPCPLSFRPRLPCTPPHVHRPHLASNFLPSPSPSMSGPSSFAPSPSSSPFKRGGGRGRGGYGGGGGDGGFEGGGGRGRGGGSSPINPRAATSRWATAGDSTDSRGRGNGYSVSGATPSTTIG